MSNPFFTLPVQTILQDSGLAYSGAKVYFYDAGTTNLASIYEDVDHLIQADNPVTCNAAGRFADSNGNEIVIYPQTNYNYKISAFGSDNTEIWTQDPINFPLVPTLSSQTFVDVDGTYYAGIDQNNQTGTSYTIQNSDWSKVVTYNNSSAVTVTLPNPTGSTFIDKWFSWHTNIGTGTVTINASANINGSSSYVLYPNYSVGIVSNGSTYFTIGGNSADLIARAGSNLTINAGSITTVAPFSKYLVDTEGAAATDDLTDIVGGSQGKLLILSIVNSARNVVIKNNTGSAGTKIINPRGQDVTLDVVEDTVVLQYDLTQGAWIVISVANTNQKSISNYVSADTAMPAHGTAQSFTHGLGGQPFMYSVWLVNVTGEGGYVTGDAIMVSAFGDSTSSPSTNLGITTYTNAANTQIIVRVSSQGVVLPPATSGSHFSITAANWNIRVKAFRFV